MGKQQGTAKWWASLSKARRRKPGNSCNLVSGECVSGEWWPLSALLTNPHSLSKGQLTYSPLTTHQIVICSSVNSSADLQSDQSLERRGKMRRVLAGLLSLTLLNLSPAAGPAPLGVSPVDDKGKGDAVRPDVPPV